MGDRFDWRYEFSSIYAGMDRDLQKTVGQVVPWHVFDPTNTVVDSIYDTGALTGVGRVWKAPISVPVLSAVKMEGDSPLNKRGLYVVDTLNLVISPDALRLAGLWDVVVNPDNHNVDRIVYENKVFDINQVRVRGAATGDYSYAVVGVQARQVKREELVEDSAFWRKYIPLDQA